MSENRGNTKMCSVLFVDIAGYSKKTNAEQIALKERFVSLWGQATKEVPTGDVMVVDAGDGAALTSLVEAEDTIRVALKLRELVQIEGEQSGEPMPLRIGINFGPVQLSTDVHGKPCIVGDAINIAQRVMSFADPGQIMVSRSYYDVILPLSHKYKEMFYYLGKRADKHVRYHDVYGLGVSSESASMGQASAEGLMHTGDADADEAKREAHTLTVDQTAKPEVAPKPGVIAKAAPQPARQRSSVLGKFWNWLISLFKDFFFFAKFIVLLLVIYELVILVPVIKKPDQVKEELKKQALEIKETLAGLRVLKDTIKPQLIDGQEQAASAASQPTVISAGANTHTGKAATGKVKDQHNQ